MLERQIQNLIRLEISRLGAVAFRNNVGLGWVGQVIQRTRDWVKIKYPRPLHAGLCEGSSDLIGFRSIVITPEDVGKTVAIFMAVEVKKPGGRRSPKQIDFLEKVSQSGGIAIVAIEPQDIAKGFKQWGLAK